MDGSDDSVTCAAWIRRPDNEHLVVIGKSTPPVLEIFSYDLTTTSLSSAPKVRMPPRCCVNTNCCEIERIIVAQGKYEFEAGVEPLSIASHPGGDDIVCSTTSGACKLFEIYYKGEIVELVVKESIPLQDVGPQKCLAFSVDGSTLATGGVDGHLRMFEWPNMSIKLNEPRAHKSFQDMDFSLDSEYLATTSTDGSARIWQTSGVQLTTLTRSADENIELCRFSKDGTKPFLFTAVQKGNRSLTVVWDITTWKRIGYRTLLKKPAALMSVSLDGKYLALGSKDGDICVVEVKKMEVRHWTRRLHMGSNIGTLEFCPSDRVILTTSREWGVMATKLNVPADWKEWQIYLLLFGLFLASVVAFYVFFENSDSFWNFPQTQRPKIESVLGDPKSNDQWSAFGPLDM